MSCPENTENCGCESNPCGCKISSDDVAYQGPSLECAGIEPCDTLTVAMQKLSDYACSVDMIENIITNITNNVTLLSQFTTIVNQNVDCDVVFNCLATTSTTTTLPVVCTEYTWEASGANDSNLVYFDCFGFEITIPAIDITDNTGTVCVLNGTSPAWDPDPQEGVHTISSYGVICSPTTTTTTTLALDCLSYDITILQQFLDLSDGGTVDVVYGSCPDGKDESITYSVAAIYSDALCALNVSLIRGYYYVDGDAYTFPVFPEVSVNPCTTTTTTTIAPTTTTTTTI
jgi:hypothetical protein